MSEIIERVAKAICEAYGHEWRTGTYPAMTGQNFEMEDHDADRLNNGWRHIARAAIEAMREPTLSMVHAGAWAGPFTIDRYMAMIDSALSQDTHSPSPLNPPADEEGAAASSGERP